MANHRDLRTPKEQPLSHAERDNLPSAGFLRRIGAMIYDGLLLIAVWLTTLYFLVAFNNSAVVGALVQTLLFLECYAFFAFFWLRNRKTLGMLAWHLELQPNSVAGPNGGDPVIPALTLTQVTFRFVGACLSILCLGLGYLWILIDPQKRSWADLLSRTRIVQIPNQFVESQ